MSWKKARRFERRAREQGARVSGVYERIGWDNRRRCWCICAILRAYRADCDWSPSKPTRL